MAFNFRLNLQSVFRRLGIQSGARLPKLNDNVTMAMIVTDLSRLVPAPIEPRGLAGANIASGVGVFSWVQLHSRAPGGIFLESIVVRGSSPGITDNYVINVSQDDANLPQLFGQNVSVGGEPIFSRFTGGQRGLGLVGASLPIPTGTNSIAIPLGIFVPNQWFYSMTVNSTNERLDIAMFYRELPAIEEIG